MFYGKGKLKDCRKNLFRIYLYSHSRDVPALCALFVFSDLSGYIFSKIDQIITLFYWKYRTNVLR